MTKQDSRQPVSDPRQLTIDELDKDIVAMLDKMKVGEYSQPTVFKDPRTDKQGVAIVSFTSEIDFDGNIEVTVRLGSSRRVTAVNPQSLYECFAGRPFPQRFSNRPEILR